MKQGNNICLRDIGEKGMTIERKEGRIENRGE